MLTRKVGPEGIRRPRRVPRAWFALAALGSGGVPAAQEPVFPPGFEAVQLPGFYDVAVGFTFAPDGTIFLIEKPGRVRVHDGAQLQTAPVLDLADEVNGFGDRGLLGVALHPGFAPDGGPTSWIYLLYTVSPVAGHDPPFDENDQYSFSRLTRYQLDTLGGDVLAAASSRQVLLGSQLADGTVPDGIASLRDSHSNGSLHFADDGSLLVALGDGSFASFVDGGGNDAPGFEEFVHPTTGLRGPLPQDQDSGAFRSQDLRSLAGKILRLDPETGWGYPSNPFFDGDPASHPSRVWALGLRNPFRMNLVPGTGAADPALGQPNAIFLGDVGWFGWEEIDVCLGGENFQWPCRVGPVANGPYQSYTAVSGPHGYPDCKSASPGVPTGPALAWNHDDPAQLFPAGIHVDSQGAPLAGFTGSCAIGGVHYAGGDYPAKYHLSLIHISEPTRPY